MSLQFSKIPRNKGAAMLLSVIFFLFISLAIIAGLVGPSVREFKNASDAVKSRQSLYLSEAGIEDAVYRIQNFLPISESEVLTLGDNSATTTITTISGSTKEITSEGDVNNLNRKTEITLSTGAGVSFNYGVQVGQGGIDLQGSSGINGNVYAHGPITGTSSSFITGTAISANSPALSADQSNGSGTPGYNVVFGNNAATEDIAQSFVVSETLPLNKVQFYIKKTGSPSNATVKIMSGTASAPGTTVIASGTLSAATVTSAYGWVDVSFTLNPLLSEGTTYWLVIDASSSTSKYYTLGASLATYANGLGKIGKVGGTWNNTTPAGLDYFFKTYLGGLTGLIAGSSGSQWNQLHVGTGGSGSAQAHTVNYTNATGPIYCQSGTGNNKTCTSQADPAYIAYPVSDANITEWQAQAESGGTISGNYTTPSYGTSTLGPKKITGDLYVSGSHTLYLTGTLWIEGNVTIDGAAKIVLHSSFGNSSGIVLADGWLNLAGSGQLNGTGQPGSYMMFVTTSHCDVSTCGKNAISISGAAGSVILNAQNGTIGFSGSASAKEATAYRMVLSGATTVNYESGLANVNFSNGPSGAWNVSGWKEVE